MLKVGSPEQNTESPFLAGLKVLENITGKQREAKTPNAARSLGGSPVVPHQTEALTGLGHPGGEWERLRFCWIQSLCRVPEVILEHWPPTSLLGHSLKFAWKHSQDGESVYGVTHTFLWDQFHLQILLQGSRLAASKEPFCHLSMLPNEGDDRSAVVVIG